ncbi:hypothetical protein, partial [Sanguibacter sp. 26GB23]
MKTGWLLLIGILIKVGHEQIFGASQDIADLINATVAIDAHLFGTISGLTIIVILYGKLRLTEGLKEKIS